MAGVHGGFEQPYIAPVRREAVLLFLFYYDEVKLAPPAQVSFWLGGIAVEDRDALEVEAQVGEIAKDFFGTKALERGKEFHGKEILNGKGSFKNVPISDRARILERLLSVISSNKVLRFYIKINPENFVTKQDPAEVAFMFLTEKVNSYLNDVKQPGMLFGDYDEPAVAGSVVSLSRFKETGTYWAKSSTIDWLVDTVHFAKSHHSRFVQLADVYLYAMQFFSYSEQAEWRKRFCKQIRDSGIMKETFSKSWPREKKWYQ